MTAHPDPKLPDRYDVERWAEASQLPRLCCEILWFFARRMAKGSTVIPPAGNYSLTRMAAMTKISRRHLQRGLSYLEEIGLIIRHRPSKHDAQVLHKHTMYTVVWPELEKLGTASPRPPRAKQSQGLGTQRRKPRATVSQELGTSSPAARDTTAHEQTLSDQADQAEEIALVIKHLEERTGARVSEEWAAQTAALILARPSVKNRRAYLIRTLVTDQNPRRWLPTPAPPPYKSQEEKC